MVGGQRSDLIRGDCWSMGCRTDHKRINRLLRKARKDRIDVAAGAGGEDIDWLPDGRSCGADVCDERAR